MLLGVNRIPLEGASKRRRNPFGIFDVTTPVAGGMVVQVNADEAMSYVSYTDDEIEMDQKNKCCRQEKSCGFRLNIYLKKKKMQKCKKKTKNDENLN